MNLKRILSLILAMVMVLSMLAACGNGNGVETTSSKKPEPSDPVPQGKVKYTVNLVNPIGEPCGLADGVAVRFLKADGSSAGMAMTDDAGVATKTLEAGDYTVQLQFTNPAVSYGYDAEGLTLSATKTELTVEMYNELNPALQTELYVPESDTPVITHYISEGHTKVELVPGVRNYFIFIPNRTGFFEFSFTGDITKINLYGMPQNVLGHGAMQADDFTSEYVFTYNMHYGYFGEDGGAQNFVLGIDAGENTTGGMINILRQGEYIVTPDIAPWIPYEPTIPLVKYDLPAGAVYADFDMNQSYELVLNPEDNFYHLGTADGPLVLMRLGSKADDGCRFRLETFQSLLANTPEILGVYNYDENGEFVNKTGYVEMLQAYMAVMDEPSGLHPLTEDIKIALQDMGAFKGWWDITKTGSYLFVDENGENIIVNPETAWLFNCVYLVN